MANPSTDAPRKKRWGFVMESDRCIDCQACMVACSVENNVPIGKHRNWINHKESGIFPNLNQTFMPENCHHCNNAPCERVCPTGATYHRDDGLVLVDYDKCIGCKYCMMACPYDARYVDEEKAAVDKCTFCVHRLDVGQPPACVETCIGRARHFGDLNDPNSKVSKLLATHDHYQLYEEAGTESAIYYIRSK
ncbi:4Fe-4S dicluster domain-containing protein [Anaerolineales bacterium HSG6]|nr:4Fe-4S dicluster domain-containing protein [Anaerolineales bacterium HSG6]